MGRFDTSRWRRGDLDFWRKPYNCRGWQGLKFRWKFILPRINHSLNSSVTILTILTILTHLTPKSMIMSNSLMIITIFYKNSTQDMNGPKTMLFKVNIFGLNKSWRNPKNCKLNAEISSRYFLWPKSRLKIKLVGVMAIMREPILKKNKWKKWSLKLKMKQQLSQLLLKSSDRNDKE